MQKSFYLALALLTISTQNFGMPTKDAEQSIKNLQKSVQDLQRTSQELAAINQLFKQCEMKIDCIKTGLKLLSEQHNESAKTMLEDLNKRQSMKPEVLEKYYNIEK